MEMIAKSAWQENHGVGVTMMTIPMATMQGLAGVGNPGVIAEAEERTQSRPTIIAAPIWYAPETSIIWSTLAALHSVQLARGRRAVHEEFPDTITTAIEAMKKRLKNA